MFELALYEAVQNSWRVDDVRVRKKGAWREDDKYISEMFFLFGDAEYACGIREELRSNDCRLDMEIGRMHELCSIVYPCT